MRVLPVFLSLAFLGASPNTGSKPVRPKVAKKVPKRYVIPRRAKRLRHVAPTKNKEASAELAALLRAYVAGKGATRFERKVIKRMDRSKRRAAKRILSRLDRASSKNRTRAIGSDAVRSRAFKQPLKAALLDSASQGNVQFLLEAFVLPPEDAPKVTEYELRRSGLITLATEDSDGTDELSTMVLWVKLVGKGYEIERVDGGTDATMGAGSKALPKSIYKGFATTGILVTAVIEDDNGNAAQARDEIEILVGLAASVATSLDGDRVQVFQSMLDYTVNLDAVGADPSRAARSIVATAFPSTSWKSLYAASRQTTDDMNWKVAVPHSMGTGSYEVLLDVPSSPPPPMPTVRVSAEDFHPTMTLADGWELRRVRFEVSINGEEVAFERKPDGFKLLGIVERKLNAGDAEIRVKAVGTYAEPGEATKKERCFPTASGEKCITIITNPPKTRRETIDLSPTSGTTLKVTYSTKRGGFVARSGKSAGKAATNLNTQEGTGSPHARVTLRATHYGR